MEFCQNLQLAQYDGSIPYFNNIYEDIDLILNFTGGIIIVKDSIEELIDKEYYEHIWAFKTIYELIFKDGKLIEKRDIADKIAEIRNKLFSKKLKVDIGNIELKELIKTTLIFEYRLLDTFDGNGYIME